MECIKALGNPTINEFASFMCISPPNAAYKVNSLIKKGYVRKVQSTVDRREFHLEVTQKYMDYYNLSANYMREVMDRISRRFGPEDCAKMEEMLRIISEELMPEIEIPNVTVEKN
jgi:DNA-binding MarR family transcriptional regulator